jgi:phenylalanyl-tRNA synthetase beta chain
MVGYGSITPAPPMTPAKVPYDSGVREFHHHVRDEAVAQGFTEVHNYSFVSEDAARAFGLEPEAHVQVANPIAADQNLLRMSLLPGVWKNIGDNARHFDAFKLFEIGYEHREGEHAHFVAALFAKDDGVAGLLELKRLAECLLPGAQVRPATATRHFEHPQRAADVVSGERTIGRLFEFHPRMVEVGRAAILDLNLNVLHEAQPPAVKYQQLPRFPSSEFDLTVIVRSRVFIADLEERIRGLAKHPVTFLDDFHHPNGDRSLSYRITVSAPDRTLSADEVTAVRTAVIDGLRTAGYELKV